MESVSTNSASAFDRSFGTESQPQMFHFIEGQKWNKLRKMFNRKTCKEMCAERDDSGLSLLGMALGFEAPLDIIKSILETDPSQANITDCFGATPLHVACLNGASPEAVLYLLDQHTHLAKARDRDNRLPLHHAVECLCRDEIEFNEGAQVINYLIEAYPDAIHASDKHQDSPIDLVQLARMKSTIDSKEFKRLSNLYVMLREISIRVYKNKKVKWEGAGYDTMKMKMCDAKSRSTVSTKESSIASSFNTNRDTQEGMKSSDFDSDKHESSMDHGAAAGPCSAASYEEGTSTINSESPKKTKKIRLKFWKK
jgi:hypothetical protein